MFVCGIFQHIGAGAMVIASFQQTLWTVQPVSSGAVRQKSVGGYTKQLNSLKMAESALCCDCSKI